ncbi:MAG: ribonuclease P protein component [Pseudomonadota bacterium]
MASGPDGPLGGPAVAGPFVVSTPRIGPLRKRADFLRAAKARGQGTKSFHLQARRRADHERAEHAVRLGITCSRKVGNAVARNRAKRRLREAGRCILKELGQDGWDYVLIGRKDTTAQRSWDELLDDLRSALQSVH